MQRGVVGNGNGSSVSGKCSARDSQKVSASCIYHKMSRRENLSEFVPSDIIVSNTCLPVKNSEKSASGIFTI
jgi:hypothetical protein